MHSASFPEERPMGRWTWWLLCILFRAIDLLFCYVFAYTSVAYKYLRFLQYNDIDVTGLNPKVHVLAALYPLMWCIIIAYVATVIAHPQWLCYPLMRKAEDRRVAARWLWPSR